MENEFLNFFDKFSSHIELGMSKDIQAFLEGGEGIENFNIKADEKEVVSINIKLRNFSEVLAKKIFMEFVIYIIPIQNWKNYRLMKLNKRFFIGLIV